MIGIRGYAIPSDDPVELYADGDRWTTSPAPGSEVVAEGWILPGLVDVHTHPGADKPNDPLSPDLLRANLERHLDAGVTAIRSPGLAGDPPDWFGTDPALPRAWHAGPWLAQREGFFEGGGRQVDVATMPDLATAQAARTGWAKVIGDWTDVGVVPAEVLAEVTRRVHEVGGRVAVHCQHADSCAGAVAAGVDSIEHGQFLDPGLLDQMARQGTAFVPTYSVFVEGVPSMRAKDPSERRDTYLASVASMPAVITAAHEAGVTVLAGTDSAELHGGVATEIRNLCAAGLSPEAAIGAASWIARSFLGLDGLEEGGPADAVVFATDPRLDLGALERPERVVLRGRVVR
jgi:imidazolonepropionase-like amidohydrolase